MGDGRERWRPGPSATTNFPSFQQDASRLRHLPLRLLLRNCRAGEEVDALSPAEVAKGGMNAAKETKKCRRRIIIKGGHSIIIAAVFFFFFFLFSTSTPSFPSPLRKKNPHFHFQGEDILGFLDVRDVAHSLLDSLPADVVADAKLLRRMKALEDAGPGFAAKSISDLPAGYGGDGSFLPASRADKMTLLELVHDAFLFPKAPPMAKSSEGEGGAGGAGGKKSGVSHRVGVRRKRE